MALSKDEVIKRANPLLELLRRRHDIRAAYLFGSFATGTAKDFSDIDLAVVVKSLKRSEDSPYDEAFQIFHEAQEYNSLFEVVCFEQDEFDRDGGTLVKKIKKEGIKLL